MRFPRSAKRILSSSKSYAHIPNFTFASPDFRGRPIHMRIMDQLVVGSAETDKTNLLLRYVGEAVAPRGESPSFGNFPLLFLCVVGRFLLSSPLFSSVLSFCRRSGTQRYFVAGESGPPPRALSSFLISGIFLNTLPPRPGWAWLPPLPLLLARPAVLVLKKG